MVEVGGIGVSSMRKIKALMVTSGIRRFCNNFMALFGVGAGTHNHRAVSIAAKTTPMACRKFGSNGIRVIFLSD